MNERTQAEGGQIPAGDSPPLPRWPLLIAAGAWGGWLVFLLVMMVMRIGSSGG